MESMALAYVTPKLLVWARTRANFSRETLAAKFTDATRIEAWESGTQIPTFAQAETFAKRCRVPLLTLFMTEPPPDDIPLTDLRTPKNERRKKLSRNLAEVIDDAVARQDWYREEFPDAQPRILAKQFALESNVIEVGEYLRKVLWINNDLLRECRSWKEYLEQLSKNAEAAGVLVLRSAVVRNDTRRTLDPNEFRGFALVDDTAPLIFINANDTTTAQIFTLVHELVHLCIRASGISNPSPTKPIRGSRNEIEVFCNQVAAEILVPEQKFVREWQSSKTPSENLKRIVRFHKVSHMVALRRAYDLSKIPASYFFKAVKEDYEKWLALKKKEDEREKKGGPTLAMMLPTRNSLTFTTSLFVALQGGKVAYTVAARLLGISTPTLDAFARQRAAQ